MSDQDIFKQYDNIYTSLRSELFDDIRQQIESGRRQFTNSSYFHFLQLTDYMISKSEQRLYISTKGFIRAYENLKNVLKDAFTKVKDVKVISSSSDEKVEKFFEELGLKKDDFLQDKNNSLKHCIITDEMVRIGTGEPCSSDTNINDIKANVYFNKNIAAKSAKYFEEVFPK